jgi:hypothetical protein
MHHEKLSAEEHYSSRELCVKIFHTTLQTAMYAQKPLTQADIDALPQVVRLVNETDIKEFGFISHINPLFRFLAEKGTALLLCARRSRSDRFF